MKLKTGYGLNWNWGRICALCMKGEVVAHRISCPFLEAIPLDHRQKIYDIELVTLQQKCHIHSSIFGDYLIFFLTSSFRRSRSVRVNVCLSVCLSVCGPFFLFWSFFHNLTGTHGTFITQSKLTPASLRTYVCGLRRGHRYTHGHVCVRVTNLDRSIRVVLDLVPDGRGFIVIMWLPLYTLSSIYCIH